MAKENTGSAIQKAFRLLDIIVKAQEPLSLADLSLALAQPKPSVHRLLLQLEEVGMVKRDLSARRFLPGDYATDFAVHALQSAAQAAPVQSILKRLVGEINESCNIGVMDRFEIVYIARVESDWPLRLHLQTGSRLPLHCTATGKLFLAYLPAAQRRRLLRSLPLTQYTEHTLSQPPALEKELQSVRRQGFAVNDQEYMVGLVGAGVPVFDKDKKLIAGLALQGPQPRLTVARARTCIPALQQAALDLADVLD